MVAYSLDLRERIIRSCQEGQSKSAVARTFMVSLSVVKLPNYSEPYPGKCSGLA